MMNLLMVDDDPMEIMVAGKLIHYDELGIAQLFTANRVWQAKEILLKERIDLVICDIEMPRENGLELLEWMQAEKINATALILTSYADFGYASKAIKVGTTGYLLKPVEEKELNQALAEAIVRQKERRQKDRDQHNWQYHIGEIQEQFFKDVCTNTLSGNTAHLITLATQRGLQLSEETVYQPLLIGLKHWDGELARYDQSMRWFILKNIAGELFAKTAQTCVCIEISERSILLCLSGEVSQQDYIKAAREMILFIWQHYRCSVCIYEGQACELQLLGQRTAQLLEREAEDVLSERKILLYHEPDHTEDVDYNEWNDLLSEGRLHPVEQSILDELREKRIQNKLTGTGLKKLQKNIVHEVYIFLKKSELDMDHIFLQERYQQLENSAVLTLKDFEAWLHCLVELVEDELQTVKNASTPVGRAKAYIRENLEDIEGCQDVAQAVFLDSDYLSKLFRKETGISLNRYINQEKISRAKELLSGSDISVSEVAMKTGFKNFSHFSTTFKKAAGVSPVEYRREHGSGRP